MTRFVSLCLLVTGCSWITMTKPPTTAGCAVHAAPPIIDGLTAAALGVTGVAIIAGTSDADYHTAAIAVVAVPALVIGTLYAASALHGVDVNRTCGAAHQQR